MDNVDHLRPDIVLPNVSLPTTEGAAISLATLPGRSLVIVYPWTGRPGLPNPPNWDDIPGAHGSTPELVVFRDLSADFAKLGVALFGLSLQATEYQREMVKRLSLPFPILSDVEREFSDGLGLPSFVTGGETYLKRLTLLIEDGCLAHLFYPVREPERHAEQVLCWLGK